VTQLDVLEEVLARLHEAGIPYALTGSYASTYWGEPRSTHDIDFVVMLSAEQAGAFADSLGPTYYADPEAAREAPGQTGHFNVIHLDTGVKIDLWVVRDNPYDRERLARRVAPEPERPLLVVLAPEDVILSKLQWIAGGAGERHQRDILSIIRTRRPSLDVRHLRRWAARLGLSEALETLLLSVDG